MNQAFILEYVGNNSYCLTNPKMNMTHGGTIHE